MSPIPRRESSMRDPKLHWRYRHPALHRIERMWFYSWEYVTWGPLYFVRRGLCRVFGHIDDLDDSDLSGRWFCRRCMESE